MEAANATGFSTRADITLLGKAEHEGVACHQAVRLTSDGSMYFL
jgi:hypothetical protein